MIRHLRGKIFHIEAVDVLYFFDQLFVARRARPLRTRVSRARVCVAINFARQVPCATYPNCCWTPVQGLSHAAPCSYIVLEPLDT
jgi:hypothetical protein